MGVIEIWVAEFVLRRHQNPRVYATSLFSALKLDDCPKLKTSAVVRDMSNSLIRGQVDERMLDLLEVLEKLQEDSVTMESLKSAYCWTAVECTLRFMWPETASDGFFGEALERIWGKRIGILKVRESDLVTPELLKWESDLKMAVEEPDMYQKIRETNIRYNAISHLNQLLKEQWALLGCSSLELEARKWFLKRKDPNAARERGKHYGYSGEEVNDVEDTVNEQEQEREPSLDTVNEQEQEHEPSLDKADITVARELKDCLLEIIQGLVEPSTRQGQENNNATGLSSVDVSPQPDRANRTETGRGRAEDSQGTSSSSLSGRVRPYLPTPKPLNVSSLKKDKPAKTGFKRPVRHWTPEEVQALRDGVKEYGKSWKDIKKSNPLVFAARTEVNLKDKWRNLIGR
ncbi:hypothetical protein EUTSA_v10022421mg [Eutrema salsugineum]|uniref:Uncharacterized protein n=1 Tax=Eutrema salsugineum TaxID=72664 RepID=V4M4I2_EUTSA|nr:uncharacterized protein LOC18023821 [Eutrema salsugineum]ESQ49867.1 hypothetical protein EUTSA_v10022421mg [Eutrema salsugineum]